MEYRTKRQALESKPPYGKILCNRNIKNYFYQESYASFMTLVKSQKLPMYYEFISDTFPVNFFLDIDIKKKHPLFDYEVELVEFIKKTVKNYTPPKTKSKTIILESHSDQKKSFHIINRVIDDSGEHYMFKNVSFLKSFLLTFKELHNFKGYNLIDEKVLDICVCREGLFRTLYSTKEGENRIFVKSKSSDDFEEVESFVCYTPENIPLKFIDVKIKKDCEQVVVDIVDTPRQDLGNNEKDVIRNYIRKHYHYKAKDIREIVIEKKKTCIVVALCDRYCARIEKEHKSNYQYIVINANGSRQKCHDPECEMYKGNFEISSEYFSQELRNIMLLHLNISTDEIQLIQNATKECSDYIIENFDIKPKNIEFDRETMLFRGDASTNSIIRLQGKCINCQVEHQISSDGYCIKCKICSTVYPKNQFIPFLPKFKNLDSFWQVINHGTIIINNYNSGEEAFNCDVNLDNSILKNKKVTLLVNQILDGHKITKISQLLRLQNECYVYDDEWYFFNNNVWKVDKDNLHLKKVIWDLANLFMKVQLYYASNTTTNLKLVNNIKCLINKLNKPGFKREIVEDCKLFFHEEFRSKLNTRKTLVPFTNGCYDLLQKEFRITRKEDYVSLTLNYPYEPNVNNPKVHLFLQQILPLKPVRDYILKKFSECLNGNIPNTKFLMLIGNGANGKSQLLNLMKLTMGDMGEKVEVTLLTRKRNNANETNTEKVKLMNKRFAFLSEPEDGEKMNISLLKELTGSEEIVARGLYTDPLSFIMEAKLFLACNELPDIKGEDPALWRRIRVINFPSRFVDIPNPLEENEYQIDMNLPSMMKEDPSWRQTFLNILLKYYYIDDIVEPPEIQINTAEYRDDNNEIDSWCKENIQFRESSYLELSILCGVYFENKSVTSTKMKGKFRKNVEQYILGTLKKQNLNLKHEIQNTSRNGKSCRGWENLSLV